MWCALDGHGHCAARIQVLSRHQTARGSPIGRNLWARRSQDRLRVPLSTRLHAVLVPHRPPARWRSHSMTLPPRRSCLLEVAIAGRRPWTITSRAAGTPIAPRVLLLFVEFARIAARRPVRLLPLDVGKFLHRALTGGAPLALAHVRGGIPEAHAVGKRFATATRFAGRRLAGATAR